MLATTVLTRWMILFSLVLVSCARDRPSASRLPTISVTAISAASKSSPVSNPATSEAPPPTSATATPAEPTPAFSGGRLSTTARPSVARAAHTATLLPDGKVLIVGGCTLDSCELGEGGATAELYDPVSGSFTATGSMNIERVGHTATRLPSGEVLIAGGWSRDGVVTSAEVYSPTTGSFTVTGSMRAARAGYTATPLPDGSVLMAGGYDGTTYLASAELYDPVTGAFNPTGSMMTPRAAHAAATLPGGRALISGGSRASGVVVASAEVYDPTSGKFVSTGDMAAVRHKHAVARLRDSSVLIVGGSDERDSLGRHASAEVYDPSTGRFELTASMRASRFKLSDAVVVLRTGGVLVAGGGEQAEVYDAGSRSFDTVEGSFGTDWSFTTATLLSDGRVLVVGGYDEGIHLTPNAWVYQP